MKKTFQFGKAGLFTGKKVGGEVVRLSVRTAD